MLHHPHRGLRRAARWASLALLPAAAVLSCSNEPADSGAGAGAGGGADAGAPLELASVAPHRISARGGDKLTLRGSGFTEKTTVRLGGELATDVAWISEAKLRFTAPPLYAGQAELVVDSGAESATLPGGVEVLRLDLRFVEAPDYALPARPSASIVGAVQGDFDGNGSLDLVTCAAKEACRFLSNDGRGNFTDTAAAAEVDGGAPDGGSTGADADAGPPQLDPHFPAAVLDVRALVAADFDGDGALDLFLGGGDMSPGAIYQNDGKAIFTDVGASVLPLDADAVTAVAVGDLDGDGKPDLVVGNSGADSVPFRIYLNDSKHGSIRFKPALDGAVPERDWIVAAVALGDVDGDGSLDIVLATPGAADGVELRLLLNDGTGSFTESPAGLPSGPAGSITALALGDLNGDGAPEIVAVSSGQDRLLLNDGTGHFFDATASAMPVDASKGTSVALVDLDRDQHLDLVIGNDGAETRLYLNDGTGQFLDNTPLLPIRADQTVWVTAMDVDGDADQDLVILSKDPGAARLFLSVEPSDVQP